MTEIDTQSPKAGETASGKGEEAGAAGGERIPRHGPEGFEGMRRAGRLAAACLDMIAAHVTPGVRTGALDRIMEDFIRDHGATPAPLGYRGFPKATCISVNHVVCHGIPGDKTLKAGDILNIDVTVILDGWHGDTSRMFFAGDKVPVKARRLCEVTYRAMWAGIEATAPGARLGDVGAAIQEIVEAERFSVVRDFCGHGLGQVFHCPPTVLHYGRRGEGLVLEPGMFFTIEPMVNAGKWPIKVLSDGWTAVTRDRSLSAQFEHSVGVTETARPRGWRRRPMSCRSRRDDGRRGRRR